MIDDILICPTCGSEHLHQEEVSSIWRKEDQDGLLYTNSLKKESKEIIPSKEVPRTRRNYLHIKFSCEECLGEKKLAFIQHKGSTYMEWVQK